VTALTTSCATADHAAAEALTAGQAERAPDATTDAARPDRLPHSIAPFDLEVNMKNSLAIAALLLLAATPAVAADWKSGYGQGIEEYFVDNGPGNRFMLNCDVGVSGPGETKKTNALIMIVGDGPPPESTVTVILDGDEFHLYADRRGTITTDCNACSANFAAVWQGIRRSRTMLVQFANGVSSKFSTAGAAKALPKRHCTTGFES
jgi:hypothetical protein